MLKQIANIINIPYIENDLVSQTILQRIVAKLPNGMTEESDGFEQAVLEAEAQVDQEGQMAIVSLVKQMTAEPVEKMLKIKSSPKGARVKIAAANGIRFSFGPIWNESVKKGKGIAVAPANRAKLNHQALLVGIANPETMEASALCAEISKTL
jgi:DNA-binding phage protein